MTLSPETALLAQRLADARGLPLDEAVRRAVEERARAAGLVAEHLPRRMTVEQMLAFGREISEMPLRDLRSRQEIMDDLNDP